MSSPEKQPHEGKHISLAKALGNCNHFNPNKVAHQLKQAEEVLDAGEKLEAMDEDLLVGANDQPR